MTGVGHTLDQLFEENQISDNCTVCQNGTLMEKIQTMKQIKLIEEIQNTEKLPCDPAIL